MNKTPKYVKEVQELLANLDNNGDNKDKQPLNTGTPDQVIDMYIEDFAEEERITLIRKKPYGVPIQSDVSNLDTEPLAPKPQPEPVTNATIVTLFLGMLVPLLCIAVQLYFIINPYTVTVTLLTKSQQITVNGMLQLGRVISPLTLSQSQTVPTTGKGHQDARAATGSITFYNGQSNQVTIPAGTTLTGSSGVQIITDADANIPAADPTVNPPSWGIATVTAHAVNTGSSGNIPSLDINQSCCATSIIAKNTDAFHGGQDERNFQTVAPSDITNTAAPLKATLDQSMQNTLAGQLKSGEALVSPRCTPTITADHQAGQEAKEAKVTVSEMCSAIAYHAQELTSKVTQLLTAQAQRHLGTGYSMLATLQVQVTQAAAQNSKALLSFKAQSTWVYALTTQEQQQLKQLIAGKTTATALQLLAALPGIERVSLQSSGFGDGSRIPKDISYIHLALIYGL